MVQAAKFFDLKQLLYVVPVFLISFSIVKPFTGILRHSTTRDITKIIFSLSIGGYVITFISWLQRNHIIIDISVIPYSVIIIHFALSTLFAVTARLLAKGIFTDLLKVGKNEKNIMIFGAGKLGQIARNALITDDTVNVKIIGFIDDNRSLHNKSAGGIPIYSVEQAFSKIVRQQKVTELIIAIDNNKLPVRRKREIVDLCLSQKLTLKQVPTVNFWINGSLLNLKASEIKKVQIEDLLGRDSITLDRDKIKEGVKDAVVLITGAAGSIGSEIVRQLILFKAAHIILLDKAESDLYNLQNEIWTSYKQYDFTAIVGDVTNEATLRKIFEKYSPSIVINAAAYKHVPLMEEFPCEAIRVNIGGTRNLANLSVEFGVKKFVQVSTDKAVNPTNVMGASKRISEIYIQALAQKHKSSTQFITTRFGNVLGSNGSVIPLFKKQIENGGPVTVTHEEITRFFMTIPEACMLVLEACFMAKGGEIFVFDMGEPVKIYNLAEKMIFLSGFIPHKDIKIEITGLRPGEKLYEELLTDQEDLQPTHNDKILIGKNTKHSYYAVNRHINQLLGNADVYTNQALVDYMHEIVPEFVSQNSYYTNHTLLPENLQLPLNSVLVTK
jgi:FlaA1/EpsC-like NDP-sugar epimerase